MEMTMFSWVLKIIILCISDLLFLLRMKAVIPVPDSEDLNVQYK